ncbi:glycosyltransferase family 2 protein [Romboutsia lituseburensis]|uniref:glycosyltransferase family 2 protein n=1 Tax=Romboutsia lituseburensis TaxID=1537 RepID=UPI00215A817F|nr:glycosyltransferase [Romboutsia lituseburensis]MCR8746796.1 glycosyltransferase [Romboutsia lituseburensis]
MSLISIIVPVYNVEKYIHECIDSIINQTYSNIEIILVNDGSTDNSGNICEKYEKKDNRIKVVHKKNGGLSDARNVGIDISNGDYICFIDSDDWINLDMIENLYNLIIRYNADIAQSDYVEVYNKDSMSKNAIKEDIKFYNSNDMLECLYGEEYVKTVVVWNKMYKKELFNQIRFPKGKLHEDEFTTYKIIHKANMIIDSNLPLYYYRQRENSIMNSNFNIKRLDAIDACIEQKKYFKKCGLRMFENKVDAKMCGLFKYLYLKASQSNLHNRTEVLSKLNDNMKKNYISFILNKEIKLMGKMSLTLAILNRNIFCNLYSKHINNKFKG